MLPNIYLFIEKFFFLIHLYKLYIFSEVFTRPDWFSSAQFSALFSHLNPISLQSCFPFWLCSHPLKHTPILPLALIAEWALNKLNNTRKTDIFNVYLLLGGFIYFSQGNSNSLASVDIAAGYTGMKTFEPAIVAFLIGLNMYGGYLIMILLYLKRHKNHLKTASMSLLMERSFEVVFFLLIVTSMRYHLFVWTVFSPKLLYELAFSLFLGVIMTLISCISL